LQTSLEKDLRQFDEWEHSEMINNFQFAKCSAISRRFSKNVTTPRVVICINYQMICCGITHHIPLSRMSDQDKHVLLGF